jgi:hypothetical protein
MALTRGNDTSAAAVRTFVRICRQWGADSHARARLLGAQSVEESELWLSDAGELPPDALTRIGFVFSIYRSLHTLFPVTAQADGWVLRPNDRFGGDSAMDVMVQDPEGLERVCRYLLGQMYR